MAACTEISLSELFGMNDTESILDPDSGQLKQYEFSHYTTIDNLRKIVTKDSRGNCFFFLRNIAAMNDIAESDLHKADGNRIHSFCTCCTKHEKIPLWYLYSGICGNGVKVKITPANLRKFIRQIEVVYPVREGHADYEKPLIRKNGDFSLLCGWVFYQDGEKDFFYKNKKFAVSSATPELLRENFFVKRYEWEYEREFRIIIKNQTSEIYDRLAVPLPEEIIRSFRLMFAPETHPDDELKQEFAARGIAPGNIKDSRLKIKMSLLKNNRDDIISHIDQWCDGSYEAVCQYISSIQKCSKGENAK